MSDRKFETLNGMRGVAAIVVALGHGPEAVSRLAPSSYLAVDLFFVLSGFVLAHSYDARMEGLRPAGFLWRRVARLWPFYCLGLGLGAAAQLYGRLAWQPDAWSLSHIAGLTLAGLLLIPVPTVGDADAPLFGLNGPSWSLFFELLANALFAVTHPWMRGRALAALIAVSGLAVVCAGIGFGGLDVGWSGPTLWGGLARVAFGFFTGVALERHGPELGRVWRSTPVLLMAGLVFALTRSPSGHVRVAYDLVFVLLVAPAAVLLGAAQEPGRRTVALFAALGLASYGLYTLHVPTYEILRRLGFELTPPLVAAAIMVLGVAVLLLDRVYDQPLRALLTSRMAHRRLGGGVAARSSPPAAEERTPS